MSASSFFMLLDSVFSQRMYDKYHTFSLLKVMKKSLYAILKKIYRRLFMRLHMLYVPCRR